MMEVLEERSACLSTVFGFGTYAPACGNYQYLVPHAHTVIGCNKRDRGNPRFC